MIFAPAVGDVLRRGSDFERRAEAVEAAFGRCAACLEPGDRRVQAAGSDGTGAHPPTFSVWTSPHCSST
jgi:hypothetical protein